MSGHRLTRIARRLHRREEGQAAIEFLLVLPIFVLFFLLLVDFGILMYQYVSLSNAVREGARFGAVNCGDGSCTVNDVKQRVWERSGGLLGSSDAGDIEVYWLDGPDSNTTRGDRGDPVVVKIRHTYDFLFFPAAIDVVSCSDMRLEQRDVNATTLPTGSGCTP